MKIKLSAFTFVTIITLNLSSCSIFIHPTEEIDSEAINHRVEVILDDLSGMRSFREPRRAEMLAELTSFGEVAVPSLFEVVVIAGDALEAYRYDLDSVLVFMCSNYPQQCAVIALDKNEPDRKRWMALFAIRYSGKPEAYGALIGVLNQDNPIQLKHQAIWALANMRSLLSREELLKTEEALITLLRSGDVQHTVKEHVIVTLAAMKSEKAIPVLIELLDDTNVARYSIGPEGGVTWLMIAHGALVMITGRFLPNDRDIWQSYWNDHLK